jgi:hypothetical protein
MFKFPDDAFADSRQWLDGGVFCTENGDAFSTMGHTRLGEVISVPVSRHDSPGPACREPVAISLDRVYLHWPLCGAVNCRDHKIALYVQRVATRQYRRTYQGRQVRVTTPRSYEACAHAKLGRLPGGDSPETLRALFYPWYPSSVREATEHLEGGWFSIALTRRITLVNAGHKCLVYDGSSHVGYLLDGCVLTALVPEGAARKLLKAFKGEVSLC